MQYPHPQTKEPCEIASLQLSPVTCIQHDQINKKYIEQIDSLSTLRIIDTRNGRQTKLVRKIDVSKIIF